MMTALMVMVGLAIIALIAVMSTFLQIGGLVVKVLCTAITNCEGLVYVLAGYLLLKKLIKVTKTDNLISFKIG